MNGLSQTMNAALAAFSRGDIKTARASGEAALRTAPKNASVLQFLGVVHCQAGDAAKGAGYFRQAIANGGDNADNRLNLAKALFDAGQYDEAGALCDGADASPDLVRLRAEILKAQGRSDEAFWNYEDLAVAHPDDFDVWNNLGNARHARGDLEGAMTALERARQLDGQSSLVHVNLGRLLVSMDRHEEACLMLEKAALLSPKDPAPLLELGRALTGIDHAEAALRALGTAARLDPKDPAIFVAIGIAFTDLENHQQAERAYRFAIQAGPDNAAGYLQLGILLEKANRVDELEKLVGDASTRNFGGDEIDWLQALLLGRKGRQEEALARAQSVRSAAIHATTRWQYIGQLADRLGQVETAFHAFEEMNGAMAQTPMGVGVDRSAYQRAIAGLTATVTPEYYASWLPSPTVANPPAPVFLVGFPRSGTTLLDTIMMGHDSVHMLEEVPIIEALSKELGDLDAIAALDAAGVARMRNRYFEELEQRAPVPAGKLVIDKNPLSMIRVPLIHRLFPDAKFVLALRHPCDVVLSNFMQNFKPTEAMASFLDLSNASRAYDRIFEYWERCAAIFPIDTHVIRYEEIVENAESAARPLFDYLGLEWDDKVLDHQKTAAERGFIRTPSYAQVTEKIYSSASGRWQRYRNYMDDALPVLEPWAKRFGYSLD